MLKVYNKISIVTNLQGMFVKAHSTSVGCDIEPCCLYAVAQCKTCVYSIQGAAEQIKQF
jgi:hypothetical protein